MNRSLLRRMYNKFTIDDGCWLWTGATNGRGYGRIGSEGGRSGRMIYAHRVMYELFVGPIPEGLELDHLCRNPSCIRPDHLEPVTHLENVRRGKSGEYLRERTHCSEGHPFEGDNLAPVSWGRRCRACRNANENERRRQQRRAAGIKPRGWQSEEVRQRNVLIRELRLQGRTLQAISNHVGLTPQGVARVLRQSECDPEKVRKESA